ncbi:hypothetical protein CTI12_AA428220 [Artemisia annua]|uniref:Uncharacterized protein n=1 Tax=Artemisia annua TaxID=35608 RepID=A0A2U1M252_ARTAN|nr:hypothetical protein CTI12_AA428220 [Artemisia annua]
MAKQAQTFFLEEWLKTNSGVTSNNPHVKLILSILSAPDISLPTESYPPFLRLLYIWVRKSSKPSPVFINSSIIVLFQLFSSQSIANKRALFFIEGLLLLGAFTFVPSISEETRSRCLELFCKLFEEDYKLVSVFDDLVPSVLAEIGYALSSSGTIHFVRILDLLFGVWNKEGGPSSSLPHGLMLLHLVEWVLYYCIQSPPSEKGAAGALRSSNRSLSTGLTHLRNSAEQRLEIVAGAFISKTRSITDPNNELEDRILLQCISLALSRSGAVSSKDSLLLCLASAILTEIIPLRRFYSKILGVFVNSSSRGLYEVKEHLNNVIFKEAGVITSVFCKLNSMPKPVKAVALMMLQGKDEELIQDLEKIAESAFLMGYPGVTPFEGMRRLLDPGYETVSTAACATARRWPKHGPKRLSSQATISKAPKRHPKHEKAGSESWNKGRIRFNLKSQKESTMGKRGKLPKRFVIINKNAKREQEQSKLYKNTRHQMKIMNKLIHYLHKVLGMHQPEESVPWQDCPDELLVVAFLTIEVHSKTLLKLIHEPASLPLAAAAALIYMQKPSLISYHVTINGTCGIHSKQYSLFALQYILLNKKLN